MDHRGSTILYIDEWRPVAAPDLHEETANIESNSRRENIPALSIDDARAQDDEFEDVLAAITLKK
jgi:hypothetical protein